MTPWSQLRVLTSPANPAAVLALAYSDTGIADKQSPGIDRLLAAYEVSSFSAECGRWLDVIGDLQGPQRSLVLGVGTSRPGEPYRWIAVGGFLFDAMQALRLPSIQLPSAASIGSEERLGQIVLGALLHSFRPEHRRARPKADFEPLTLVIDTNDAPLVERAQRVANVVNRARAWVERPANLLAPPVFAAVCQVLEQSGARVRVLDANELERLGAGGIIAVGRGAEHGPNLAACRTDTFH